MLRASSSSSSFDPARRDNLRSLYWCFTFNNPPSVDEPKSWPDVRYAVWQKERASSGTLHLQGYLVFNSRKRLSTLKKLSSSVHWEKRNGTHTQAKLYCQKADTRVEGPWIIGDDSGIPDCGGTRTDLLDVKQAIDEGKNESFIYEHFFETCARHYKFFREYRSKVKGVPRDWKTQVYVLWGPTGTGKSRAAREAAPQAFWKSPRSHWWDGYDGQLDVVIDEFYGWIPYDELLRILDEYALQVQVKGGHVSFVARRVIITSNKPPQEWYDPSRCPFEPLKRRLENVINLTTRWSLNPISGLPLGQKAPSDQILPGPPPISAPSSPAPNPAPISSVSTSSTVTHPSDTASDSLSIHDSPIVLDSASDSVPLPSPHSYQSPDWYYDGIQDSQLADLPDPVSTSSPSPFLTTGYSSPTPLSQIFNSEEDLDEPLFYARNPPLGEKAAFRRAQRKRKLSRRSDRQLELDYVTQFSQEPYGSSDLK